MLTGHIREIASLTDADRDRMFRIMLRHYAGVREEAFRRDLSEKEGALVLQDAEGNIQGFSTYQFMHTRYRGEPIVALFSGDTIIDKAHWGTPALFDAFGRLLHRLLHENPGKRTYWFLITKGYRTYLMLPLFFKRFYPRFDQETPPYEQGLIDHLATARYDGQYEAARGIIRGDSYYLAGEFAEVPPGRLRSRDVRFFLEKNPGYVRGDELACVCEISPESFRRRTRALVRP